MKETNKQTNETYTQLKLRLWLQRKLANQNPHANDPQLAQLHYLAAKMTARYANAKQESKN